MNVIDTYAAYAKDEYLRLNSSSGAVFSLLAEKIFLKSGVVYGVAMTRGCRDAEYIRTTNQHEFKVIRGSKYLQAKIGNTYQLVKHDVESNIPVLFSGTGCQVNGLKAFLGKEYSNLICVDVVCHGTPSPKLWRNYIDYMEHKNNAELVSVNFRCKDVNWVDFGMKEFYEPYKVLYISKDDDPYMRMFLRNYCLRPSCYACTAKDNKRSDITIGDFWGIQKVAPDMNDGKGVSLVITRTERGQDVFEKIKKDIFWKEVSYEDGVKRNSAEYTSVIKPIERDRFFLDLNALSFSEMEMRYAADRNAGFINKAKNKAKKIFKIIISRGGRK